MSTTVITPDLIRRAREAMGMSQQRLAHALAVQKETVYRWEAGRKAPTDPDRLAGEIARLIEAHIGALGAVLGEIGPSAPRSQSRTDSLPAVAQIAQSTSAASTQPAQARSSSATATHSRSAGE